MGVYSEYLDRQLTFSQLSEERKAQLRRISQYRGGRDVIVFAADLNKGQAPISINYADILPFQDQLSNLGGSAIDLILETPGGSAEVGEDLVRLLRSKYDDVGIIVAGYAKSAGTIMAMSGDEILMDSASSLGPIDAQIQWQGLVFSADALLKGLDKIKDDIRKAGVLNKAYIPILQQISPGELQHAQNALEFSRSLVKDWLVRYKFRTWSSHSSTGAPVTQEEKEKRAEEIARELCDHGRWYTHARPIKLDDLERMRLRITNFADTPELADAIRRYYALLQMSFATNIYKVFETVSSQIYRYLVPNVQSAESKHKGGSVAIEVRCGNCGAVSRVQGNLESSTPLQPGCVPFPSNDKFVCPHCATEADLSDARREIEMRTKCRVVT